MRSGPYGGGDSKHWIWSSQGDGTTKSGQLLIIIHSNIIVISYDIIVIIDWDWELA